MRALPLVLLVGVREKIFRQIFERTVGRLRRGLHQRSHVRDNRQRFLIVEVPLHLRHVRVQPVDRLSVDLQRQQLALRQRQHAAGLQVLRVPRVCRHQHVVAVISAKHENAHQRFVIRGALRQRAHQPEFAQSAHQARAGRRAARQSQQVSSCVPCHRSLLCLSAAPRTWTTKGKDKSPPAPGPSCPWDRQRRLR